MLVRTGDRATADMAGGVYPGWWVTGWAGRVYWEGLYRVLPGTLPGPIFRLIPEIRPSYGQMKAILVYL